MQLTTTPKITRRWQVRDKDSTTCRWRVVADGRTWACEQTIFHIDDTDVVGSLLVSCAHTRRPLADTSPLFRDIFTHLLREGGMK